MDLQDAFQPTARIKHARTQDDFIAAVKKAMTSNGFILNNDFNAKRPLLYLGLEARPEEAHTDRYQYFYVQETTGKIIAAAAVEFKAATLTLSMLSLSVLERYRRKDLAKSIIHAIMGHTRDAGYDLEAGSFMAMGREYIAPAFAKMHRQFPDLPVSYDHARPILGDTPYHLVFHPRDSVPEILYL